jgi:hypothetical protein
MVRSGSAERTEEEDDMQHPEQKLLETLLEQEFSADTQEETPARPIRGATTVHLVGLLYEIVCELRYRGLPVPRFDNISPAEVVADELEDELEELDGEMDEAKLHRWMLAAANLLLTVLIGIIIEVSF